MFINADKDDKLYEKEPDFTIINACSEINDEWKEHNLNSYKGKWILLAFYYSDETFA